MSSNEMASCEPSSRARSDAALATWPGCGLFWWMNGWKADALPSSASTVIAVASSATMVISRASHRASTAQPAV